MRVKILYGFTKGSCCASYVPVRTKAERMSELFLGRQVECDLEAVDEENVVRVVQGDREIMSMPFLGISDEKGLVDMAMSKINKA